MGMQKQPDGRLHPRATCRAAAMRSSAEASGSRKRPRMPMWSPRPRQPSKRPSAVRRRRRQPKQKGWLLAEMKPTVPCLPSRVVTLETPARRGDLVGNGLEIEGAGQALAQLGGRHEPGLEVHRAQARGHQLDEALLAAAFEGAATRASASWSFTPRMTTVLMRTGARPAASAASMPARVCASTPP